MPTPNHIWLSLQASVSYTWLPVLGVIATGTVPHLEALHLCSTIPCMSSPCHFAYSYCLQVTGCTALLQLHASSGCMLALGVDYQLCMPMCLVACELCVPASSAHTQPDKLLLPLVCCWQAASISPPEPSCSVQGGFSMHPIGHRIPASAKQLI